MADMERRCRKCGLPLRSIDTNTTGGDVCDLCKRYEKKWKDYDFDKAEKEFLEIIESYRNPNAAYDCIVPFSGGKDSSYVLYYLRKKLHLRTLAVNLNNGFQANEAERNVRKIVTASGSASISYTLPWDVMKKLYQQYTLLSGGDICCTCNVAVSHTIYKFASQEKVPLIVWGFSPIHESSPIYAGKRYCREKLFRKVLANSDCPELADVIGYDHYKRENELRSIFFFNYIKYDENDIIKTLQEEYDWEMPKHGSNKADCGIFPMANYFKQQSNGFGRLSIKYAALVRDGQMKLEDAEKLLEVAEDKKAVSNIDEVMNVLDIKVEDILSKGRNRLDYIENINSGGEFEALSSIMNVEQRAYKFIDLLRPEVERDGGSVAFEAIRNGLLYIKVGGDCRGCFLQQVLTNYVDTQLLRYIPELNGCILT